MDFRELKRRYVGLDIVRVVSAFVICMFHTTVHLGANYGIFQGVSIMGAVFMTMFFMLSGFSLFVNWGVFRYQSLIKSHDFGKNVSLV